jgi:hypothetical protein
MRSLRLVAISAFCLACSDATGISVQGPSFLRAKVDGRPLAFDENDSFVWSVNGTILILQAVPGTMLPAANPVIGFQVGHYQGPGTYVLEVTADPGPITEGWYGVVDGSGTPLGSFATVNGSRGSIRIVAEDTTLGSIVGTFEFSASSMTTGGEIHITQGSFRIRR